MTLAERIAEQAVVFEEGREGTSTAGFVYVECFGCAAGSFWKADRHLAKLLLAEVRARVAALIAAELGPVRKALTDVIADHPAKLHPQGNPSLERAEEVLALLEGGEVKEKDEERKRWIDNASYEQLLSKWRFAPSGDPFFQGEIGQYYAKVLSEKRQEVGNAAHVAASKALGWER